MYSIVELNKEQIVLAKAKDKFAAALEKNDYQNIICAFVEYHDLKIADDYQFDISICSDLDPFVRLFHEVINKPVSNVLILDLLKYFKEARGVDWSIALYSHLYCKKDFILNWEEVAEYCESAFSINLDLNEHQLKEEFKLAVTCGNTYTKAWAIFCKVHLSEAELSKLSVAYNDVIEEIQAVKIWPKKIGNFYLETLALHLLDLHRKNHFLYSHNRRDTFYHCLLKQQEHIEDWYSMESFFSAHINVHLNVDYHHVFFISTLDFSLVSLRHLLEKDKLDVRVSQKYWYQSSFKPNDGFEGYCTVRYGEDSCEWYRLALPPLHFVIAFLTRPDVHYKVSELFDVIKLFVAHDPKCLSYKDSENRDIRFYLERCQRIRGNHLKTDAKKQFDLDWEEILNYLKPDKISSSPDGLFYHDSRLICDGESLKPSDSRLSHLNFD